MTRVEQHHTGDGDNVARDKIINEFKALAPEDLKAPMELVLESIRQKDKPTAKTHMAMLRTIAQREEESAALVDVISIYGGLVDDQDYDAHWKNVAKIISGTTNPILKDVCQAALLRLSYRTEREIEATTLYLAEPSPGMHAREAYLRYYADDEQLRLAVKGLPSEGVLTGAVEGALRLESPSLAIEQAARLNSFYASYNARVLMAMATGLALNLDLVGRHLWLNRPEVKERLDELSGMVVRLLGESGTDERLHSLACSILEIYQYQPGELLEVLKKHVQHLNPDRSYNIAICKALAGDDSHLSQAEKELQAAYKDPQNRKEWCRRFLDASPHDLEEVGPFIRLAKPSEIDEWLSREQILFEASEIQEAYIRLVARVFRGAAQDPGDRTHKLEVEQHVDKFVADWAEALCTIRPEGVFEVAEKLFAINLPHKALKLITPLIPHHELWPSPYVLSYLHCLHESGQNSTFNEVFTRIKGADQSAKLLSFQSVQAERNGDNELAIRISESMIQLAAEQSYTWYRRCYLLNRYRSLEEQQAFHSQIPDSVLLDPSREVKGILFFLALAGNFKRAEKRWVKWMIEDPRSHAVDFINFHFGLTFHREDTKDVSFSMEQCLAAVQYTLEGDTLVRLIIEDEQEDSEYTLKASSHVGQLLLRLLPGDSEDLNMATYKMEERLPPYVACLRIAFKLRHAHNDGSDGFVMMHAPTDPDELISFFEKKLVKSAERQEFFQTVNDVPVYLRGHALYPSDAFKAAINFWTDRRIPKPSLCNMGDPEPAAIVLDAYGISYLAVTNFARCFLDIGVSFVLPAATKDILESFLADIYSENFMLVGVNEAGKLFRTTGEDIRERDAHVLEALRLILDHAIVVRPVLYDVDFDTLSIKELMDVTVYDAMQLSEANRIPWFCMDGVIGVLHNKKGHPLANVQAILLNATKNAPFDFEHKRHSLLFYSVGALPLPLTLLELYRLARTPSSLAGFILFQIIKNHGHEIFSVEGRQELLLNIIFLHLNAVIGKDELTISARYDSGTTYSSHVLNHGLKLYLSLSSTGTVEFRLATAVYHFVQLSLNNRLFQKNVVERFAHFAHGHFLDWEAIGQSYWSIDAAQQLQEPGRGRGEL